MEWRVVVKSLLVVFPFVGTVGVRIRVRSSYSQQELAMTEIRAQAITVACPVLYHWAIPISRCSISD